MTDPITAATQPQHLAADPTSHVWVSAAAGSGKTRVLVNRLLRLLLGEGDVPPTAPHRILCLTYTKAAAAEMRARLEKELMRWATGLGAETESSLTDILGHPPDQKQMARARSLFADISDSPQGLHIQTIHSFCQSILARFPLEAGITPGFVALDEDTARPLLQRALETAWQAPGGAAWQAAKAWMAEQYSRSDLESKLKHWLMQWPRTAEIIGDAGGEEAYAAACFTALQVPRDMTDFWTKALSDTAVPLDALRAWVMADYDENLEWFLVSEPAERAADFDRYLTIFLTTEFQPRKNLVPKKYRGQITPDQVAQLEQEQQRVLALWQQQRDHHLAKASAAAAILIGRVATAYQAEKAQRGALDFADMVNMTRRLLETADMHSWVHYKLDGGIDHILLDEAQDTAPAQWKVVCALVEEFFSGAGRRDSFRSLFVVGDPKQSIYSFQGADARLFQSLEIALAARAEQSAASWRNVPMQHSFRSAQDILTVVDATFESPQQRRALHGHQGDIRHHSIHTGRRGQVRVHPPIITEKAETPDPLMPADDGDQSSKAQLAEHIAAAIADWLAQRRQLSGEQRAIRPGDIIILLQERTGLADPLLQALHRRGVPVMGHDRLPLLESMAVQDLLCLLKFMLLPDDDLNLAQILRGPWINWPEAKLAATATRPNGQSLWHHISQTDDPAIAFLRDIWARADFDDAYDALARCLTSPCPAAPSGWRALAQRLGPDCLDAVKELLSLAIKYRASDSASGGLEAFVHQLGAQKIEIKREMGQLQSDAVRIMTVHGAKGLEAPVVILADASELPHEHGSKTERMIEAEMEEAAPYFLFAPDKTHEGPAFDRSATKAARGDEHQRLLYVAMTRAAHELHIFGKVRENADVKNHSWYAQISHAMRQSGALEMVDGGWILGAADSFGADAVARTVAITEDTHKWQIPPIGNQPAPPMPRSVSDLMGGEYHRPTETQKGDDGTTRLRGTILHRLFELLPTIQPEQQANAAEQFITRQAPHVPAPLRAAWAAEVMGVLYAPETAPFFGPHGRAEVSLCGSFDGIPVIGTVDRFYVTDSDIGILDFKTGQPPTGPMPPHYARQLQIYASLLRDIYPGRRVRAALCWTQTARVEWLPDSALAQAA